MKHLLLTLPFVFLLPACGPGDETTVAGTDDTSGGTIDSESTTDVNTTEGPGTDTEPTTGEPEPEPEPEMAHGIHITKVTADQGVEVPIGLNGGGVGGGDRNAYLINARETLIRVEVDVEDGWTPREIRADLTLTLPPDQEPQVSSKTLMITGDTDRQVFDSAIWWFIPADFVAPGMSYSVTLWETTPDYNDLPDSDPQPMLPLDGSLAAVGIEDSHMVLKVGLVPIKHVIDGQNCGEAPEIDENLMKVMKDQLYMQNPVDEVEMVIEPTMTFEGSMQSFGPLLTAMSQYRNTLDTPPEKYLYGLTRPCDGGADGVGGQAYGIPTNPIKGNAYQRVSIGRRYASNGSTAETFVHEVGHTQGRYHIACNGTEAGTDPSYPYTGGDIGVYGFGVISWTVHPPENHDYMTYCGSTWVSDWGWNKVYPIITELSSWEFEDQDGGEMGTLLVGALYPDGTEDWWTTPGSLAGEPLSTVHSLELQYNGEVLANLPAAYNRRPDSDTFNIAVQLPEDVGAFNSVERIADEGVRHPVAFDQIKWLAN